ncbi:MAG: hypothetical protein RL141_464 [Candidatus Parcubacteria bacterium]|jgi:putative Holliday junction resolvase
MRVLGIDYGAKRIGVALGDTQTRIATAWEVIPNDGLDAAASRVADIAEKEEAEKIIIGIPMPLRDATLENDQVREIRGFIFALREAGLYVEEWDEAYSSALAAHQEMAGRALTGAGRVKSSGGKRDDLAAAALLEGWLQHAVSS